MNAATETMANAQAQSRNPQGLGIGIANIRKVFEANSETMNSQHTANLLLNHLETLRSRQVEVTKQLEETSAMLQRYSNE